MIPDFPPYKFCLNDEVREDKRFLPTRGEPKATGYDVRACLPDGPITLRATQTAKISLGLRAFCPDGWWFEMRPRSSTFVKKNLLSLYGIVDESYEGQVVFACQYLPDLTNNQTLFCDDISQMLHGAPPLTIKHGDAIGQIVPVKRQPMEVLEVSPAEFAALCAERGGVRGEGGFGSTGV